MTRSRNTRAHHVDIYDLAQRIQSGVSWDDILLPDGNMIMLAEIAANVRHLGQIRDSWGFPVGEASDDGVCALFSGPRGTGKTMAAQVVAGDLGLELLRVDLSHVVTKYVGETEKNLDRIFTAVDSREVILLFDEADSLFGKRGDVRNSRDRYADIEVGYLLQRLEQYRGLAILTSKVKTSIDDAFLRRINYVVEFPFPDAAARKLLWHRSIGIQAKPGDDVDVDTLARDYRLSGGAIVNIVQRASLMARKARCETICQSFFVDAISQELQNGDRPRSSECET